MILDDKLAAGEVIALDGATGTEIARLGGVMDNAAWCAAANLSHPDIVRRVHEAYIKAGADVVIANTFATCRHVLAGAGLAERTEEINRRAVELAREAVANAADSRPVAVAGSMSNMVAWQPGTISPDPRFMPTPVEETANYHEMATALADGGADLIVLEMMLDIDRASRALEAALATGLPVWVGVSCSRRADGSMVGWDLAIEERGNLARDHMAREALPLADIIAALTAIGGDVYGIMHSSIAATTPGLDILRGVWKGPVMAYPETLAFDAADHQPRVTIPPADFAVACRGWVASGVQIVGGCCGTTIEHIRAMTVDLPAKVGAAA